MTLPAGDDVFTKYFAPWYSDDDLRRRGYPATRPDAESYVMPGTSAADASPLVDEARAEVEHVIDAARDALAATWPQYLDVEAGAPLARVGAFDQHWTRARAQQLLERADPEDASNALLAACSELGVAIADALRQAAPQLEWLYDWPHWESGLLDVATGYRINPFHWAIKRFSEDGVEDGYVAKIEQCVALLRRGWEQGDDG
jgi:hypothetical protein